VVSTTVWAAYISRVAFSNVSQSCQPNRMP
jgi:hypothetical protein